MHIFVPFDQHLCIVQILRNFHLILTLLCSVKLVRVHLHSDRYHLLALLNTQRHIISLKTRTITYISTRLVDCVLNQFEGLVVVLVSIEIGAACVGLKTIFTLLCGLDTLFDGCGYLVVY